jgi:hypothetical protein
MAKKANFPVKNVFADLFHFTRQADTAVTACLSGIVQTRHPAR